MSNSTTSPNMNLVVPIVGSEAGPQYATDINTSLGIIDSHNHSPGFGVQINTLGLNINSSLTFNGNFATSLAGLTLTPQSTLPIVNTIYESGVDLYYLDGVGNNVRITQAGSLAGTPGSIGGLTPPASVTYVPSSQSFVFQSGTSIAANLDAGAILIRNISPNSTYAVTLNAPASLPVNYNLTLPLIPAVQSIMTIDTSGNMAGTYTIDNTTIVANGSGVLSAPQKLNFQAPTQQIFTMGSGTYTTPAGVLYIEVLMAGGGGGGGGAGSGGASGGSSGTGSTFGTLLTCNPGGGASPVAGTSGAGGTATITSPAIGIALQGGFGNPSANIIGGGAPGGNTPFFGGGGSQGANNNNGQPGLSGTGGGGQGGGNQGSVGSGYFTGPGGGAGGFIQATIPTPASTYSYTCGPGGGGGTGSGAMNGGQGGAGIIIVKEFYQ